MVKRGFSLAEALVVMAIISIFFAAGAKIITTRPKVKTQINPHGYFECYKVGGTQYQRSVREELEVERKAAIPCVFTPPSGTAFFSIITYGPGNLYHSSFEPNINNTLKITMTTNSVTLASDSSTARYELNADDEEDNNDTQQNAKIFFETMYPDSMIYNGGAYNQGVMISW